MSYDSLVPTNGKRVALLGTKTIGAALTNDTSGVGGAAGVTSLKGARYLSAQAKFVYGAGGTTVKAWLQTSFDGGLTWIDVINFAFTTATLTKVAAVSTTVAATHATPTDAALADNTINNGLLGDRVRVKITSTGVYTGVTNLTIDLIAKG